MVFLFKQVNFRFRKLIFLGVKVGITFHIAKRHPFCLFFLDD